MSLEEKFIAAQARAKALTARPSNEDLLALYALYKQATDGDVKGSRPGMMDFMGRAKYDAWATKKGLSKDQAMTDYVAVVDRLAK